jgi:hypothetical protein
VAGRRLGPITLERIGYGLAGQPGLAAELQPPTTFRGMTFVLVWQAINTELLTSKRTLVSDGRSYGFFFRTITLLCVQGSVRLQL